MKSHLGLLHRLLPLREVPDPAWVLHIRLEGPDSVMKHLILRLHLQYWSQQCLFQFVSLNACLPIALKTIPFCVSSHVPTHISFLCPHTHPHLPPLILPFVFPPMSLPGSPVCNSLCFHPNMPKQRCLMILTQVKVLVSDRLLPSIAESPGASCDWHQKPPLLPTQTLPVMPNIEIHFSLTKMTESGVPLVNYSGGNSALLVPLWYHQTCQHICCPQYCWLTEP